MNDLNPDDTTPTLTVWQVYKSRFLYTQAFILIACVGVFLFRRNWILAATVFLFLQLTALYGSWMGKRLLDQINAQTMEEGSRKDIR